MGEPGEEELMTYDVEVATWAPGMPMRHPGQTVPRACAVTPVGIPHGVVVVS